MKLTNTAVLFLGISILPGPVPSSGQNATRQAIRLNADFARFAGSGDRVYAEIYIGIPRGDLSHRQEGGRLQAVFETEVSVFRGDSLAASDRKQGTDRIDSLGAIKKGQRLNDQFSFFLKEGDYRVRVKVMDLAANTSGSVERNLEIRPVPADRLEISDIELGAWIAPDSTRGRFVKNGMFVAPNPTGMYGIEMPLLYYYCEIYNLAPLTRGTDSSFTVRAVVKNTEGSEMKTLPFKTRLRAGRSVVDVGKVNVAPLVSGTYSLELTVTDQSTGKTASRTKPFVVYRPADRIAGSKPANPGGRKLSSEFFGMEEPELDHQFDICRYISTKDEEKTYGKLDLKGQREFLSEFWERRNTDPSADVNPYKKEYLERVDIANGQFSTGRKQGRTTDQGRVMMLYGRPDDIEPYPNNPGRKPYQIWNYYSIEGGVIFVFADLRNNGEMRLLHSEVRKEIHNDRWEELLRE
jgi:GWxTD domain-containing protein